MGRILVIEDDPLMRHVLTTNLVRDGHDVVGCSGVVTGRNELLRESFDAVFVDQKLPDGDGLHFVDFARECDSTLSVIMLTAMATVELAVNAMRRGAFDFLAKPFEPEGLLLTAQRGCERTALLRENTRLRREVEALEGGNEIFGASAAMQAVRSMVARVAPTSATVLITGETGTGKELVARAIHNASPRAAKAFIAVNCAAFTESLLETELFGHEKGAFTGADRSRQGLFEAANEGTLFLDEVGELTSAAQAKLLRVLTDGHIVRVGSTQPRKVNVRLLAATHRDLMAMVKAGEFRQDLYYRLAVVPIAIPPLRDRATDIPMLCEVLSRQASLDLKTPQRGIEAEALQLLQSYDFPGNVRELRNLIERAYILSNASRLGPEHFAIPGSPATLVNPRPSGMSACAVCPTLNDLPEDFKLSEFLRGIEKIVIERMIERSNGVQAEAARRLGLSRSALFYKLH